MSHDSVSQPPSDSLLQEETMVTDITIGTDGRIFIFGTSRPVIELLAEFQPDNSRLKAMLNHLRQADRDDQASLEKKT